MKAEIHVDCADARNIALKANQFGDGRAFARWILENFPALDAHAVSDIGTVYVWDGHGNHLATVREEACCWSLAPGRLIYLNGQLVFAISRPVDSTGSPADADAMAHRIVALLNNAGVAL